MWCVTNQACVSTWASLSACRASLHTKFNTLPASCLPICSEGSNTCAQNSVRGGSNKTKHAQSLPPVTAPYHCRFCVCVYVHWKIFALDVSVFCVNLHLNNGHSARLLMYLCYSFSSPGLVTCLSYVYVSHTGWGAKCPVAAVSLQVFTK